MTLGPQWPQGSFCPPAGCLRLDFILDLAFPAATRPVLSDSGFKLRVTVGPDQSQFKGRQLAQSLKITIILCFK